MSYYSADGLYRFEIDCRKPHIGYMLAEYLKADDPTITELEIPAEYNGLPVTMICNRSFYCTDYLKRVVIPPSVRYIAMSAFAGSAALESVVLPNSPITLGSFSFEKCENLERVEFGSPPPDLRRGVFFGSNKLPLEFRVMNLTRSTDITKPIHKSVFREMISQLPECDGFRAEVFELLAKNNCFRHRNVLFLFRKMIDENTWEHFAIAEKYGMLESEPLLDLLISFAAENQKTEFTAYLLDLKNRKFGFDGGDKFEL